VGNCLALLDVGGVDAHRGCVPHSRGTVLCGPREEAGGATCDEKFVDGRRWVVIGGAGTEISLSVGER
jgi:hypothetical protein